MCMFVFMYVLCMYYVCSFLPSFLPFRFNLAEDVDLSSLAERCPRNLTGADLYALCSDAILSALRRQINEMEYRGFGDEEWEGRIVVMEKDFAIALDSLVPSVTEEDLQRYKDLKNKF